MLEPIKEMPTLASAGPNVEMTLEKMPAPEQSAGDDEGGNASGAVAEENSIEHQLNAAKSWGNGGGNNNFQTPDQPAPQKRLWIIASPMTTLHGVDLSDKAVDIIAYKLEFRIETLAHNGNLATVEAITVNENIIMFESKSEQQGKRKANAFVKEAIYTLIRTDYNDRLDDKESFNPEPLLPVNQPNGKLVKISKGVLIHPSMGSDHMIGCKSLVKLADANIITINGTSHLNPTGDFRQQTSHEAFKIIHKLVEQNKISSTYLKIKP